MGPLPADDRAARAAAGQAQRPDAEDDQRGQPGYSAIAVWARSQKAIACYEQALAHRASRAKNRQGEGAWLGNLGNCYADLGQTARAIEYYEQALAIAREIGDRRGEGTDLGNLGNCYADLGQTARAIEYYEQALAIAREIGDRRGEGTSPRQPGGSVD